MTLLIKDRIILDLCGGTGAWSRPYKEAGYDVRLVTLPEQDVRLYQPPENVYGVLAAPPCTMFSYARSTAKTPRDFDGAINIVFACLRIVATCISNAYKSGNCDTFKFWALENPARSYLVRFIGEAALEFNPCDFGDPWTKQTGLWGWFDDPIKTPIELTDEQERTKKINSSKRLSLLPLEFRKMCKTQSDVRAITPPGFARAFFEANP